MKIGAEIDAVLLDSNSNYTVRVPAERVELGEIVCE